MTKNKKMSILGDSVSTYRGISDDISASITLYYNPCYYEDPFPLEKTYWKQVMDKFGLTLCVNNSYSGGNLSGRDDPNSGFNRANCLSRDDGTSPDLILVFMGLNDLGRRINLSVFASDYQSTLMTIAEKHPNASVCCIDLPIRSAAVKEATKGFNAAIENAVASMGDSFFTARLSEGGWSNESFIPNTLDGLHPNENGMTIIAESVIKAIEEHIDFSDI